MVTSLIPDHDHMYLRINLFGELIKEGVHHLRVDIWGDEAYGPAGFRTGRAEHIQPVILRLFNRRGPRTGTAPLSSYGPLLTESGFVLEPDFDAFFGVFLSNLPDLSRGVFLKVLCT